jgi:RNA polymerase sigma-70 factor (ECF subfamily)
MSEDAKIVPLRPATHAEPEVSQLDALTDDELMRLATQNLRDAFATLVRRYQQRVRSHCSKWTGDRALGDDLAQEIFGELWRTRERYRPGARFAVYLFTIARNRCRNAHRDRRPTKPLEAEVPSGQPDQLQALLAAERQRRMDNEVGRLPEKLREAVLFRFGQGLDYPQMAEILGCPQVTVRSRVFLGITKLRAALKEEAP